MKIILSLLVVFGSVFSAQSQSNALPEEIQLVNEIFVSARNGHYSRAERIISQLRWTLKTKKLSNLENYKLAYKLNDSIKSYKNNPIPLDMSRAALVETDEVLEKQIKNQIKYIRGGLYEKADVELGELKIKLSIKEANENMQEEKALLKKAVLESYKKTNENKYNSTKKSVCINELKIDSILKALKNEKVVANDSVFSILQQELDMRNKIKVYVDDFQFLSASMDYKNLKSFLADPHPKKAEKKIDFVPTTENQKRIVWLQEKMMSDKQAGKYINLWPMTQELNYRNAIEKELKKGNLKEVENLKSQIKEIQFR